MSLESASFINQLVSTNPEGADPKGQGDDHLRLIKKVLKETFPGFTGALTGTNAQYNATVAPGAIMLTGMVVMWSGALASIPAGWLLCNGSGTLSNGGSVPDLRDRFVIGSGGTTSHLSIGGAATHNHTVTVEGTALTIDQMPSHTHEDGFDGYMQGVVGGGAKIPIGNPKITGATGGGGAHTHTASTANTNHLPPYVALAYIIKN